jgi:hypothetical protein
MFTLVIWRTQSSVRESFAEKWGCLLRKKLAAEFPTSSRALLLFAALREADPAAAAAEITRDGN